jgi:hypothetical protein
VESPKEELPGGAGSSDAPPGEDASEVIALEGSEVQGCASMSSISSSVAWIADCFLYTVFLQAIKPLDQTARAANSLELTRAMTSLFPTAFK